MNTRRATLRKGEPVPVDDWERPDPLCLLRPILRVTLVEWLVILAIIAVLVALLIPVGDQGYRHKYPPPRRSPRNAARCAGDYYQGYSLGYNLNLSILPDGRYSYYWGTCTGIAEREAGEARNISGFLVLTPTITSEVSRLAHVYVPVRWGLRTYLVPPETMSEFCDAIVDGEEPRTESNGNYYVSNLLAHVRGKPALPPEWASLLDQHLLSGTVIEVIDRFTVRIDLGSDHDVRVDDILAAPGGRRHQKRLRVMEVDRSTCVARSGDYETSDTPLTIGRAVVGRRNAKLPPIPAIGAGR